MTIRALSTLTPRERRFKLPYACQHALLRSGLVLGLMSPALASAAWMTEATARLGSPQPCASTNEGCDSHALVVADLDQDGDLDIVFANGGGYYTAGDAAPTALYLNDGKGNFQELSATLLGGFNGRLRQIAVGDVNGDGRPDLVMPDSYGMSPDALFIQGGVNSAGQLQPYKEEGAVRLGTSSQAGATRLGDVDDDGDLDLIITDWGDTPPSSPGTAHLYVNDGFGYFDEKGSAIPSNTSSIGTGPIDADLVDVDGDFDLDLLLASRQGDSLLFLNDGKGQFLDGNANLPPQPGPYVYGPDACDVDGDADLDLWLDNGASQRREQLLINNGAGVFADETRDRVPGSNNISADDNEVQCADVDGDGDMDVVIASLSSNERVLINDGKGLFSLQNFTLGQGMFPKLSDSTLGLDLGDLNGDGILDAVTAQGESGSYLNRLYLGQDARLKDARPPQLRRSSVHVVNGMVHIHVALTDQTTTDVGPRLSSARVELSNGSQVPLRFVGGDLFRAEIARQSGLSYRIVAVDRVGLSAVGAWATVP